MNTNKSECIFISWYELTYKLKRKCNHVDSKRVSIQTEWYRSSYENIANVVPSLQWAYVQMLRIYSTFYLSITIMPIPRIWSVSNTFYAMKRCIQTKRTMVIRRMIEPICQMTFCIDVITHSSLQCIEYHAPFVYQCKQQPLRTLPSFLFNFTINLRRQSCPSGVIFIRVHWSLNQWHLKFQHFAEIVIFVGGLLCLYKHIID